MIAVWLAGKVSGIIIFIIACTAPLLLVGLLVQTVRIDGLDLGGWYAVQGYKAANEQMARDDATLRSNQDALNAGLKTCNASVDAVKLAGDTLQANADKLVAAARSQQSLIGKAVATINAIKSTDEKCPVAQSILSAGFQ